MNSLERKCLLDYCMFLGCFLYIMSLSASKNSPSVFLFSTSFNHTSTPSSVSPVKLKIYFLLPCHEKVHFCIFCTTVQINVLQLDIGTNDSFIWKYHQICIWCLLGLRISSQDHVREKKLQRVMFLFCFLYSRLLLLLGSKQLAEKALPFPTWILCWLSGCFQLKETP